MMNEEMMNEEMNEEYETVVLVLDDGTEEEFAILDSFEVEGKAYVLLGLIKGDAISDDPDDMLFMIDDTDDSCADSEIILSVIESDEEYEKVVDAYLSDEE